MFRFLNFKQMLTRKEIEHIAEITKGQIKNPLWVEFRKGRLTASQFGRVLQILASKSPNSLDHFKKDFLASARANNEDKDDDDEDDPYFTQNPALCWGTENEPKAIGRYSKIYNEQVFPTGLWLFANNNNLGASPDGILYESNPNEPSNNIKGILEVKCPFTFAKHIPTKLSDYSYRLPYITNSLTLLTHHPYYHQVQGQLFATQAPWCDFYVWCPKNSLKIRIYPDAAWKQNILPLLIQFFETHLISLINPIKKDNVTTEPCKDNAAGRSSHPRYFFRPQNTIQTKYSY